MSAVPAHSFSAPARARLMAVARVMPGVCSVLVSRWPALTMRTPLRLQSRVVCLSGMISVPFRLFDLGKGAHRERAESLYLYGHGVEPEPARRQRVQTAQVLRDRNLRAEQKGMRRPRPVRGVVDVE